MLENYYKEEKAIELKRKEKKDSAEGIVNKKKNEGDTSSIGISVKGVDNLLIRISKYCAYFPPIKYISPLPSTAFSLDRKSVV